MEMDLAEALADLDHIEQLWQADLKRLAEVMAERDRLTEAAKLHDGLMAGAQRVTSFQNMRIEELIRERDGLEEKVMAEVERSSRTRDSIVRMKNRLRSVKDDLAKAQDTIRSQREGQREEQLKHRGFVEGLCEAHERHVARLERTAPRFIGQVNVPKEFADPGFVRRFNNLTREDVREISRGLALEARRMPGAFWEPGSKADEPADGAEQADGVAG